MASNHAFFVGRHHPGGDCRRVAADAAARRPISCFVERQTEPRTSGGYFRPGSPVVFTDATLTAIAQDKPRTERELAAIPGIGRAKLDRYGGDVLALVADS